MDEEAFALLRGVDLTGEEKLAIIGLLAQHVRRGPGAVGGRAAAATDVRCTRGCRPTP
ncbi:hypothetical protein HBB16_17165 [Pseudonocardia sp. MCCB 268]|nr:hypothetical protein [Pseudonocardia cytotoxica]